MRTINQVLLVGKGGDAVWRGLVGGRRSWSCLFIMAARTLGIRGEKVDGACEGREGMRPGDLVCAGHEDDGEVA